MQKFVVFLLFLLITLEVVAQKGKLEGRVLDPANNEPVPFANIIVSGTTIGAITDIDGNFKFTGLEPGYISLEVSSIGYQRIKTKPLLVTNAKTAYIEIALEPVAEQLEEVTVKASRFRQNVESPLSMRSIGVAEIEKNPGGNRDISKVIQSFPGVASTPAFRNDVIVRGGGANENSFYLDGVEIPNLNHFATQGASGGPVGIINVDFVREVDFYSGAFPANRGGAVSSILDFRQIDGNKEKMKYRATVGASDLALTVDGPLTDNASLIFSVRRSYLQFLFSVLELPFLPTYNDAQFKSRIRLDEKNEIILIGLGALDQFELNLDANETPSQRYILNYLPVNEQWNYTFGTVYKHYRDRGYNTLVLSRNHLNNSAFKYRDNDESSGDLILDLNSDEIETKIRYEDNIRYEDYKLVYGAGMEYSEYYNSTYSQVFLNGQVIDLDYSSKLDFINYSAFGQLSRGFFGKRLNLSVGLRMDGNTFDSDMSNPLRQFSPRFSGSYGLNEKWFVNFNTGRFYQKPSYTTLGYRDSDGVLVNKNNGLKYFYADHYVAGLEYRPNEESRITVEGFYKNYGDYPFSVADGVAISGKSADFGVFGDEEVTSTGEGRAYGLEFLVRHNDLWGFNLISSLTLVRSEFKGLDGKYDPSAWDNKILYNITATRKVAKNWDVGLKWRYVGGAPYTPYDLQTSSLVQAWDRRGQPYLDYNQFNTQRLSAFHQLDVRVDRQFYFDKWSLMLYLDIQNLYNFKAEEQDNYINEDADGNVVVENPTAAPEDQRYVLTRIPNDGTGTVLPTIGIMIEF
ncbi:MAG: TonB-dependent receptor [Salinivirgaceae bacterium]|nr:MAG: TonB-dependent receptor [Salinivirgaceae bacterium]